MTYKVQKIYNSIVFTSIFTYNYLLFNCIVNLVILTWYLIFTDYYCSHFYLLLPSLSFFFFVAEMGYHTSSSVNSQKNKLFLALLGSTKMLWKTIFLLWLLILLSMKTECTVVVSFGDNGSLKRLCDHSCVCQVDSVFSVWVGSQPCIATESYPYMIWYTGSVLFPQNKWNNSPRITEWNFSWF